MGFVDSGLPEGDPLPPLPESSEAALAATRRGGTDIGLADFTTAIERIIAGLEKKSRVLNPREREVVAHAV